MSLDWLVASLLEKTYNRSNELKKSGATSFAVRNEIQVFYAQNLSIVFGHVSQVFVFNALNLGFNVFLYSIANNIRFSFEMYFAT